MQDTLDDALQTPPAGYEEVAGSIEFPLLVVVDLLELILRWSNGLPDVYDLISDLLESLENIPSDEEPLHFIKTQIADYYGTPSCDELFLTIDKEKTITELYMLLIVLPPYDRPNDLQIQAAFSELWKFLREIIDVEKRKLLLLATDWADSHIHDTRQSLIKITDRVLLISLFLLVALFVDHRLAMPSLLMLLGGWLTAQQYSRGEIDLILSKLSRVSGTSDIDELRKRIAELVFSERPEALVNMLRGSGKQKKRETISDSLVKEVDKPENEIIVDPFTQLLADPTDTNLQES